MLSIACPTSPKKADHTIIGHTYIGETLSKVSLCEHIATIWHFFMIHLQNIHMKIRF
jgi:hypothetical protein